MIRILKYFSIRTPRKNGGQFFRMKTKADRQLEYRCGYWEARGLGLSHSDSNKFALLHFRSMCAHHRMMKSMEEIDNIVKELSETLSKVS